MNEAMNGTACPIQKRKLWKKVFSGVITYKE
jgi:hypothetical protein